MDHKFQCSQKHSFDISKEGYVNLLLANQKNSKNPGDSKFMIENRKYFLEQGYYETFSDTLNKMIKDFLKVKNKGKATDTRLNILDIGCGEGFYSDRLQHFLDGSKLSEHVQISGIDISKAAIQKAAKRDSRIQFCIGSNFHLPYRNESFDLIFSIFSPVESEELKRVLTADGKFICVRPGPAHLQELAALIYDQFQLQGNPLNLAEQFEMTMEMKKELAYAIQLKKNQDVMSLVAMTPYYWQVNEEKEALLQQKQEFLVSLDFEITVFSKELKQR